MKNKTKFAASVHERVVKGSGQDVENKEKMHKEKYSKGSVIPLRCMLLCFAILLFAPQIATAMPTSGDIGARMIEICAMEHPHDFEQARKCCDSLQANCNRNCGNYDDVETCQSRCYEAGKECRDTFTPTASYDDVMPEGPPIELLELLQPVNDENGLVNAPQTVMALIIGLIIGGLVVFFIRKK